MSPSWVYRNRAERMIEEAEAVASRRRRRDHSQVTALSTLGLALLNLAEYAQAEETKYRSMVVRRDGKTVAEVAEPKREEPA